MEYIIITIIAIFSIIFIYYTVRKRWAINKVRNECDCEKINKIDEILCPFGFEFCKDEDIIISKMDSWQKNLGFHDIYDLKAPFFYMVMQSEPIYFDYNNKHYRIEFWKGQYGITTGAEIGIYVRDFDSKMPKGFYRTANKDEQIELNFILYKKCKLFCRNDCSWWLTGFDVGNFSKPQDLSMDICLKFPCPIMQEAFLNGLLDAGYSPNNISVCCDTVCFDYCNPKNYKLNNNHKIMRLFALFINWFNCKIYMHFTRHFNTTLDKLTYIRLMTPLLFRLLIKSMTKCNKQHKCFDKRSNNKKGEK